MSRNRNRNNRAKNKKKAMAAAKTRKAEEEKKEEEEVEQVANVFMISGCMDSQCSMDLGDVSGKFILPEANGNPGGALTSALLEVLYKNHEKLEENLSFVQVLEDMRRNLSAVGFDQVPQLSSTKSIDVKLPFQLIPEGSEEGTRRALLIGINYVGQSGQLSGCHDDVLRLNEYIVNVHGFAEESITIFMDDGKHEEPTKENIMGALRKLVEESEPGDSVFFHFSGHGGRLPDQNGDEEDGWDSTLIPVDFVDNGQIRDDDIFDKFVKPMKGGVAVTCLMDACHSGSVLDLPYTFTSERDLESPTLEANVHLISGCTDTQVRTEVSYGYLQTALEGGWEWDIPDLDAEKVGGLVTAILIDVLYRSDGRSFMAVLERMNWLRIFDSEPQLCSSKPISMNEPFFLVPRISEGGSRHVLLIGINYVGQGGELQGCHNDVLLVKEYIDNVQHFREDESITILMDDGEHEEPTKENIMNALRKLAEECKQGDSVFVHYSGHATRVLDQNGDEEDGYDSAIKPVDYADNGVIRDDALFDKFVKPMKEGVTVNCVFDCSFSGSMLDLPYTFVANGQFFKKGF